MLGSNGRTPAQRIIAATIWAQSGGAILMLWRPRPWSILDLWLMMVMCAWAFDVALGAVFNARRYDLGSYAGRPYGLLAACFVRVILLLETNALHGRLAAAAAQIAGHARELEARVHERTAELGQANAALRGEMAERERIEARLRQVQKMGPADRWHRARLQQYSRRYRALYRDARRPGRRRCRGRKRGHILNGITSFGTECEAVQADWRDGTLAEYAAPRSWVTEMRAAKGLSCWIRRLRPQALRGRRF
jgi:hypothetical protein